MSMSIKPSQFIGMGGLIRGYLNLARLPWRLRRGQSLVELLIATSVIILLIGGAVTAVSVSLRSGRENKFFQTASFLAQELLDNLETLAASDWHKVDGFGVDALSPATAYRVTPPPFGVASGEESIVDGGVAYARYFNVDWVSRDALGVIEVVHDPSKNDPSTLKITTRVEWGNGSRVEMIRYLTRDRARATLQSDWSGGSGQLEPLVDPGRYDTASAGIDTTSESGSIRLSGIPY